MIRKVSIPLVVGVIVAAGVGPSPVAASISLGLACIVLLLLASKRRCGYPVAYALFFLCGFSAFCSASIAGGPRLDIPFSARPVSELILGMPFAHESTGDLVNALVTGDRSGLDPGISRAFRLSGASHILALSGLHLGIIYALMSSLLSVCGNSPAAIRFRCIATTFCAALYTFATGAGPSTVRALLFICINEAASLHPDRKKDSLSVLWTALTVQLAANPLIIGSAGFQLSYLAMLGIFTCYPILRDFYPKAGGKIASRLDLPGRIWNSAALSISCQLFTAPLAAVLFGTFPKYFLLTNLIALPLTELLITESLVCMILQLPGLCPAVMLDMVDRTAEALTSSLGIISRM